MTNYDAIVVGAGFGGLYGVHRLRQLGLNVLGLEGAPDVGGVWYHNCYPGSRVDVESFDYCYYFSEELYKEWHWSEKYATQPEILRYLNHVADRFDIRRHFLFDRWLTEAQWHPEEARYHICSSTGEEFSSRFLVMATGQLSTARRPDFEGFENFKGEWVETQHWPKQGLAFDGKRIAIIGTGSSGVQAIPEVAQTAGHLYVMQRTPKYTVPAHNGPIDTSLWQKIKTDVNGEREQLFAHPNACHVKLPKGPASDFTPEEQQTTLKESWSIGGQHFQAVFNDQSVNIESNEIIARFVRDKIRSTVTDPEIAEKLCPDDHPFGSRRLIVDTDYYETFNRDNVTLVDVRAHPINRITETGIETSDGAHYEIDLIIFALGFDAFTGSLYGAGIHNEIGQTPADHWRRGPRTLLGLSTRGFPNLFLPTGPGSPSLLANLAVQNEYHIDWIANCIAYMDAHDYASIEPTKEAEDNWTDHVAEVSQNLLRLQVDNYMVHVNEDDNSRVYIPYAAGLDRYIKYADEIAADDYRGFTFTRAADLKPPPETS
jgi:cation diffusion facilitator CzcD-associated flavoprotein CzcO